MKRLTKIDGIGQHDLIRCFDCDLERAGENLEHCGYCEEGWQRAVNRLAAYEDTGLEPEDIKKAFNEEAVLKLAAQALGTTPECLRELVKARDEGRVVVLPCKRGDEVRATVKRPYNGHTAEINGIVSDIQTVVRVSYDGTRYVDFLESDFGKTVFLTRAEAEAALNRGGENVR